MGDIPATEPSAIRLVDPPSAPARTTVTLKVYWSAGTWVTGVANLQRWNAAHGNTSGRYVSLTAGHR
jgi:hypothetical protein